MMTKKEILKEIEKLEREKEFEKKLNPDGGMVGFISYQIYLLKKDLEEIS